MIFTLIPFLWQQAMRRGPLIVRERLAPAFYRVQDGPRRQVLYMLFIQPRPRFHFFECGHGCHIDGTYLMIPLDLTFHVLPLQPVLCFEG